MKTKCFLLMASWFLISALAQADQSVDLNITPAGLDINAFYNGAAIPVTGRIPSDCDVVLRFQSASQDIHLKERGKVFGLMWMNLNSLTVKGLPDVCIIASSLSPDDPINSGSALPQALGLAGLRNTARIESTGMDPDMAFKEFIKLKKSEDMYQEIRIKIDYGPDSDGQKNFRAEIPLPARLKPGNYAVAAAAVERGMIRATAEKQFKAELTGFPAFLARMAFEHGALYGILASIIAILSGLAIGLVFQGGGAH